MALDIYGKKDLSGELSAQQEMKRTAMAVRRQMGVTTMCPVFWGIWSSNHLVNDFFFITTYICTIIPIGRMTDKLYLKFQL